MVFLQVLREKGVQQKATGAFDGAATDGNAAAGEGEHAGVRQGEEERERCEETADEGGRAAGAMREMRIRVVSHRHRRKTKKNKKKPNPKVNPSSSPTRDRSSLFLPITGTAARNARGTIGIITGGTVPGPGTGTGPRTRAVNPSFLCGANGGEPRRATRSCRRRLGTGDRVDDG